MNKQITTQVDSLNALKPDDYSFTNLPRQYCLDDYSRSIESFIRAMAKNQNILSIYQFGSISDPGISDIDFILVLQDNNKSKFCYNTKTVTMKDKYLFFHSPCAVINEKLFQNLHFIIPFFNLTKVYGKNIKINNFDKKEQKAIDLMLLNDIIFMNYPRCYLEILLNKKINVRRSLNLLKSLKYPLLMLNNVFGITPCKKWHCFLNRILRLRKNWFATDHKFRLEELFGLIKQAVYISLDMIEIFNSYMPKDSLNSAPILCAGRTRPTLFVTNWNKHEALRRSLDFYNKTRIHIAILPLSLSSQIVNYSQQSNLFGGYARTFCKKHNFISNDSSSNERLLKFQQKRAMLLSELCRFSVNKKYYRGAFSPFDLDYLANVRFPNKIRNIVWNIKKAYYEKEFKTLIRTN